MDGSGNFSFCQLDSTGDPKQLDSPKFGSGTKDFKDNVEDFNSGQVLLEISVKCDSQPQEVINLVPLKTKSFGLKETDEMSSSISDKSQSDAKTSTKNKQGQRAKVPFEKGFSQMDWLKLTRTHPDLAGLKGQSNRRLITMDEVKQQTAGGSIWTVLQGRVYNISPYMKYHPGGDEMLMKAAGKDCTSLFNKYHPWVNADFLLEKCLVGFLDVN